jgi:hypothetical protein
VPRYVALQVAKLSGHDEPRVDLMESSPKLNMTIDWNDPRKGWPQGQCGGKELMC